MQSNGVETSGVTMPNNFVEYLKKRKEPLVPPQVPNDSKEFDRAVGRYQLEGDVRRDTPALLDTLPPIQQPIEYNPSERYESKPSLFDQLVDDTIDMIKHPIGTAAGLAAFPMGLLPGMAMEYGGEVADEGWQDAIRLGQQILQHPSDAGHMVKGLGMSIAELPSIAKEHGKSLWDTMTKDFKGPSQPSPEDLQQTFEPMRP